VRWNQGREVIERMLADRQLQQLPASREHADRLMAQARRHLLTAQREAHQDPEAAYSVLYDAARKALVAILENQGLRPTSSGGHVAVLEAVSAQLDPPSGRRRPPEREPSAVVRGPRDDPSLTDEELIAQRTRWFEMYIGQMNVLASVSDGPYSCPCCADTSRWASAEGTRSAVIAGGRRRPRRPRRPRSAVARNGRQSLDEARAAHVKNGGTPLPHRPPVDPA
jgi:hypothetical protein